jgi:hypothetical protein
VDVAIVVVVVCEVGVVVDVVVGRLVVVVVCTTTVVVVFAHAGVIPLDDALRADSLPALSTALTWYA